MPLVTTISTKTGHIKNNRKKISGRENLLKNIFEQSDESEPLRNNLFAKNYLNRNRSRI